MASRQDPHAYRRGPEWRCSAKCRDEVDLAGEKTVEATGEGEDLVSRTVSLLECSKKDCVLAGRIAPAYQNRSPSGVRRHGRIDLVDPREHGNRLG